MTKPRWTFYDMLVYYNDLDRRRQRLLEAVDCLENDPDGKMHTQEAFDLLHTRIKVIEGALEEIRWLEMPEFEVPTI